MVATVAHSNGVTDVFDLDPQSMRRPGRIHTTGATPAFDTGTYSYDGAGNVQAMGLDSFVYDPVSRLVSGTAAGATLTQTYSYDPFGNRVAVGGSGARTVPTDPSTNRLSGTAGSPIAYDNRGNVTTWGQAVLTFDAFDMLTRQVNPAETPALDELHLYTADDERVVTADFSLTGATWKIRDLDGQVLREYREEPLGTLAWVQDYIRRDGQLLATDASGQEVRHLHLDHLGTVRMITGTGGSVRAQHDYFAFGEEAVEVADGEVMRFTGHERDQHRVAVCDATNVDLENQTITGTQEFSACEQLTAGPAVIVASGADVTLQAGERIGLESGFSVQQGATFKAGWTVNWPRVLRISIICMRDITALTWADSCRSIL